MMRITAARGRRPEALALAADQGHRAASTSACSRAAASSAGSLEQLEELLLEADFGVPVTLRLVEEVERRAQARQVKTQDEFHDALRDGVENGAARRETAIRRSTFAATAPTVILVVGVNGAGKTTFIGKLATRFARERKTRDGRRGRHVSRGRDRSAPRLGGAHGRGVRRRRRRAPIRRPSPSTRSTRRSRAASTSSSSTPRVGCTRATA